MKNLTVAAALSAFLALPAAADPIADYIAGATATIDSVLNMTPAAIDAEIAHQNELLDIGRAYAKEFSTQYPDFAPMMDFIVQSSYDMPNLSMDEIEAQWHEGGALIAAGYENTTADHFGKLNSIMDMMVHPSTVIIALRMFGQSGDKALLEQSQMEMMEVVEHVHHL